MWSRVAPNSNMTGDLISREEGDTCIKTHMEMEVEMWGMRLQAEEL